MLIRVWLADLGFWLESWLITFHQQAEAQQVKEKQSTQHSFPLSDPLQWRTATVMLLVPEMFSVVH